MILREKAAFRRSIQHWYRLSSGTEAKGERITSDHCALCLLFLDDYGSLNCSDCPINCYSGASRCWNTPWEKTNHYYILWKQNSKYSNFLPNWVRKNRNLRFAFQEAAWNELQFLLRVYEATYFESYSKGKTI